MSIHLINNGRPAPDPNALELVSFRVIGKPYSSWRAIIAETGDSDTAFLLGLKALHGITIDKQADPMLFMAQDTQQMRWLKEDGVENPTWCQILLTARAFALTEGGCAVRFKAVLAKESNGEEQPLS